jgi:hypothetical protein
MSAADLVPLPPQLRGELASAVIRQLQVQLVKPTHQHKIPLRYRPRFVVNARAAQLQQLRLALHWHFRHPAQSSLAARTGEFPERAF